MVKTDTKPRVAIVHDWLTNLGGAERVVLTMSEMFPDAPIYTSVYNPSKLPEFKDKNVIMSFLQHIPLAQKKHQLFPILRQLAFESFDFSGYDLVISSTSAEAKGIVTPTETRHISYINTPTRYYWSGYQNYLEQPGMGAFNPLAKAVLKRNIKKLRRWDYAAAQRPDIVLANSKNVQARIRKYYDRGSTVVYPSVETDRFSRIGSSQEGDYYLVVSRLIPYKRVDLAVRAATKLDKKLVVIGTGSELKSLQQMAGPTVRFLGFLDDVTTRNYYLGCKAFIFPAEEDFGITPVEAMAAGKPVLFYAKGGATETVIDGVTGVGFKKQTVESLCDAIQRLDKISFKEKAIIDQANKFSVEKFKESLTRAINLLDYAKR
jgi:glycosyltransferase involved in cell wall biosynthesis